METKSKCILLLGKNEYLATAAEDFCKTLFDIALVTRCDRQTEVLPIEVFETSEKYEIEYLFNFLSPLKVSKKILNNIKKYSINFHPALPNYPGVGSASYALFSKEKIYGVTAHVMEETFDSGKILSVLEFPITPGDYCDTLFDRALIYSLILYYQVLENLSKLGKIEPINVKWQKKATTRKEFEKWMTINPNDPLEMNKRKIRSVRHSRFSGPYLKIFDENFELPPRKK